MLTYKGGHTLERKFPGELKTSPTFISQRLKDHIPKNPTFPEEVL